MFHIDRGTNPTFTVEVRDPSTDALVDLAGAKIYFTARDNAGAVIIERKNTAAGGGDAQVEVTGAGTFKLKFAHADTEREPVVGICDGFVVTATQYLKVIATQTFQINEAASRVLP